MSLVDSIMLIALVEFNLSLEKNKFRRQAHLIVETFIELIFEGSMGTDRRFKRLICTIWVHAKQFQNSVTENSFLDNSCCD